MSACVFCSSDVITIREVEGGGVLASVWWKGLRETDHLKEQDLDGRYNKKTFLKEL